MEEAQAKCKCGYWEWAAYDDGSTGPWQHLTGVPGTGTASWRDMPGGQLYCEYCGDKLNADGTVTRLVPAVTPEAVAATRLYSELVDACDGVGNGMVNISDECHLLLAALQQARGLAAAEWLARRVAAQKQQIAQLMGEPDFRETFVEEATPGILAAAFAALAAGESGEPSDGELMDALEAELRTGHLRAGTHQWVSTDRTNPTIGRETFRGFARAIIAAQRGGKE